MSPAEASKKNNDPNALSVPTFDLKYALNMTVLIMKLFTTGISNGRKEKISLSRSNKLKKINKISPT